MSRLDLAQDRFLAALEALENATGSVGESRYSKLFINRAHARQSARPAANPGIATSAPSLIIRRTRLTGEAPSAARIPNSRMRPLNVYASNP